MHPLASSLSASDCLVQPLRQDNAAIWYNKTCQIKRLTPNYINIRVNGNNTRSQKTKNTAIRYRISQELKFLYIEKQQLNEQLYRIHLECAAHWPTTLNLIQSSMDSNIQQEMETHYNRLNKRVLLSGCTRQSLAESDDTRGCIGTIYVVDLLMMGGVRSKQVEESNLM